MEIYYSNDASALAMSVVVYVMLSKGLIGNLVLIWVVIAAGMIVCFLFLSIATDGSFHTSLFGDEDALLVVGCENREALIRFRWMARIALFSSWACLGVTRSQFALLFTDIGFSETWFEVMVTIFGSHLYYGACGTKKRSVQMVVYETTLSPGVVVGSGAGGYVVKNIGLYWPYWFAMVLLAVGFVIQLILLLKDKFIV